MGTPSIRPHLCKFDGRADPGIFFLCLSIAGRKLDPGLITHDSACIVDLSHEPPVYGRVEDGDVSLLGILHV